MNSSGTIGVFDSGLGGLSILKEMVQQLPNESFTYVADSGFAPYGSRSRAFILERSRRITRFLIQQGCTVIVVACNTATGAAITALRQEFDVPFVGVEPAVKPAAQESHTGHIGVLATHQTFQGEHFIKTTGIHAQDVEIHVQAGEGLVELIEDGMVQSDEISILLWRYLSPLVDQQIDQLVLGCTHYPFLIPLIKELVPSTISIHDPAPAVARQLGKILHEYELENVSGSTPRIIYYTSGDVGVFKRFVRRFGPLMSNSHLYQSE